MLGISELPTDSSSLAERFGRRRNGLLNRLLVIGWTESGFTLGEGVSPTELAVLKKQCHRNNIA